MPRRVFAVLGKCRTSARAFVKHRRVFALVSRVARTRLYNVITFRTMHSACEERTHVLHAVL